MDANAFVDRGALRFLIPDAAETFWDGSATTKGVQIGLKPAVAQTFKAILGVPRGLGFSPTSSFQFTTNTGGDITTAASAAKGETATTLFAGSHTYKVDSNASLADFTPADTGTTTLASAFTLAGSPMTVDKVDLSGGKASPPAASRWWPATACRSPPRARSPSTARPPRVSRRSSPRASR